MRSSSRSKSAKVAGYTRDRAAPSRSSHKAAQFSANCDTISGMTATFASMGMASQRVETCLIDMHDSALDHVGARRTAQDVLAPDEHLAGLRQSDTGLAAPQDNLALSG